MWTCCPAKLPFCFIAGGRNEAVMSTLGWDSVSGGGNTWPGVNGGVGRLGFGLGELEFRDNRDILAMVLSR